MFCARFDRFIHTYITQTYTHTYYLLYSTSMYRQKYKRHRLRKKKETDGVGEWDLSTATGEK